MTNCIRNDISEYDDISTKDQYQVAIDAGCSREEALRCCYENSRDNARTPMQWTDDENAGFTDGTPWLAMNPELPADQCQGAGGADGLSACLLPETGASAQGGRLPGNIHLRYLRAGLPGNGGCICVLPCVRGERTAYTGRSKLWNGCGFLPLAYPCRQVLLSNLRAESAVETACEKANALTLGSCEVAVIELG